jgi:TolB-like protein
MAQMSPSSDEIHRQLERILASEYFANAERLSRFLRYVVDRTCAGEGERLKEFVIGTEVFDRDHRYDPRLDSVVRVEAGRLRSKLSEYYARPDADDPILIRVPRGGYSPVFELRQTAVPNAQLAPPVPTPRSKSPRTIAWTGLGLLLVLAAVVAAFNGRSARPARTLQDLSIVVFPLATYSTDESAKRLAARVTDGVTRELARLGTIQVVPNMSAVQAAAEHQSLPDAAHALHAEVIVAANLVQAGDRIRVEAALIDTIRDRKFWVGDFDGTLSDLPDLQHRIAVASAAAAASNLKDSY